MTLEAEPVDIFTKNATTHLKHTNKVTESLHLWLGLQVTAVCVQKGTPGMHLSPTVCVGVALLLVLQLYPPHFLSHYTIPNRAK